MAHRLQKENPLPDPNRPTLTAPEFAVQYMKGVSDRCREFQFLLGEWSVEIARHSNDGGEPLLFRGVWLAEALFEGRMICDRFTAFVPDGPAVSSTVTLRTWCEATESWEMTFLASGQPNRLDSFTGRKVGGEMHLEAKGLDLLGRPVEAKVRFFDIHDDRFTWDQRSRLANGDRWYLDSTMRAKRVA